MLLINNYQSCKHFYIYIIIITNCEVMKHYLLAWLGDTDIAALEGKHEAGIGPIAQALKSDPYDCVYILLTRKHENMFNRYSVWLKKQFPNKVVFKKTNISDPTDYLPIYEQTEKLILGLNKVSSHETILTFHLSPGTPSMAAVWILHSSNYNNVQLIKSSKEKGVEKVNLPFNLSAKLINAGQKDYAKDLSGSERAFVCKSDVMRKLVKRIQIVSPLPVSVLIQGETGTGKERVARLLHNSSQYASGPFIAVNCGAIPSDIAESELFGYMKGAFSGAVKDKPGVFELSDKGTLFLDEIGELPLNIQVKLLRVIQEREVLRIGQTTKPKKIDFRLICATNRQLIEEVAIGNFREDLFYRIAAITLNSPPLRDRQDDIEHFVAHFLNKINEMFSDTPGYKTKTIEKSAMAMLKSYYWPGNIRELKNTILQAVSWNPRADEISKSDIEGSINYSEKDSSRINSIFDRSLGEEFRIDEIIAEVTRHYLKKAIKQSGGKRIKAARLMGFKNHQTFNNWLERYNVKFEKS